MRVGVDEVLMVRWPAETAQTDTASKRVMGRFVQTGRHTETAAVHKFARVGALTAHSPPQPSCLSLFLATSAATSSIMLTILLWGSWKWPETPTRRRVLGMDGQCSRDAKAPACSARLDRHRHRSLS